MDTEMLGGLTVSNGETLNTCRNEGGKSESIRSGDGSPVAWNSVYAAFAI